MKDLKRKCAVPARGGGKPDLMVRNLAETCCPASHETASSKHIFEYILTFIARVRMYCRMYALSSDAWCTPLACQRTSVPIKYVHLRLQKVCSLGVFV